MATIVLVHGIDQQQKSADTLENEWLPNLAGGIRTAGFPRIADRLWRNRTAPDGIDVRMAFYGHLFLQPEQQGDDPGDFTAEEEAFAEKLAEEWLIRAAEHSLCPKEKSTAKRELAYLHHAIGAEEMGRGEAVRKAIQGAARLRWFAPYGMGFAERFVKRALAQVTRYLTDQTIRQVARQSVLELIRSDTKVIVAHSLGSVVAYEAIQDIKPPLPLFVTIGSPLGLETIVYQRLEPQPPTFPERVKRWVNVADRNDFIAAEPDLRQMFSTAIPSNSVFEGGHTVDNGAQPHSVQFYLTKAQVGKPIGETLNSVL
jgi:hypothetical protein